MRDERNTRLLIEKLLGPNAPRRFLLSPKEVSKLIGRAEQTLANERSTRRGLPYVKIGRSIRYKLTDVLSYTEARRIDPEGRREG
jgi:hypothetical protein